MAERFAWRANRVAPNASSNPSATPPTRLSDQRERPEFLRTNLVRSLDMSARSLAILVISAYAAVAQTPTGPPKVVRIVRQVIKPGKAAAQERIGIILAHAMARAKYPAHFLAVNYLSGGLQG